MKKPLAVLGHGVALGWLLVEAMSPAFAEGTGDACASENGDGNADGTVDLSDGITILGHLFLGSPGQLPPLCPSDAGLPDTGQTNCYDADGNVIDCQNEAWPGQDGFHATGCPSERRFIDNGDGTVTDTCTGLMWQQATADLNGDGEVTRPPVSGLSPEYGPDGVRWQEALRYCEDLEFAGHGDWRLPNAMELESVVDYQRDEPHPSIDPAFEAMSVYYWTSTTAALSPELAAAIPFYTCGRIDLHHKAQTTRFVRAVRTSRRCVRESGDVNADGTVDLSDGITILGHLFLGSPRQLPPLCPSDAGLPDTGQTNCYDADGNVIDCQNEAWPGQDGFHATGCPSERRFIDNGDGTVTDTCTGLMWQQATADLNGDGEVTPPSGRWPPEPGDLESDGVTWQGALQYCERLEFAGHGDWRLPNTRELGSLVDYGRIDPSIDPVFESESARYWTSSTLVGISLDIGGSEAAVFVSFAYPGWTYNSDKGRIRLVRAVRGGG